MRRQAGILRTRKLTAQGVLVKLRSEIFSGGVTASTGSANKKRLETPLMIRPEGSAIGEIMESGFKKFEAVFLIAVEKSQASGEMLSEKDAHAFANFLACNMSGLKTMAKAGIKHTHLKHIVDTVINALRNLQAKIK
ncbi:hypothetical protein BH24ACI3_BH24ACI3_00270 [soil metagenome]